MTFKYLNFRCRKQGRIYNYVKLVGKCNSIDTWNFISELKIFGYRHRNNPSYEQLPIKIYPNPAKEYITVRIDDASLSLDFIQITNLSGTIVFRQELDPGSAEFTIKLNLKKGVYILQLGLGKLTHFSQKIIKVG